MTSRNKSNKKLFFSFVSIIASVILEVFYLSITPGNGTNTMYINVQWFYISSYTAR